MLRQIYKGAFLSPALAVLSLAGLPLFAGQPKITTRFYYMEDTLASMSLQAHAASLGTLSPVWFSVDLQGELKSAVDPKLVAWAGKQKLPLMPVVANVDFNPVAVQAALADGKREKLIAGLAKSAADFKFRGMELDFEEVPPALRDNFTRFIAQLADALHKQKMELAIAVPAPLIPGSPLGAVPPAWSANPRAAAFDYAQIAKIADSVTLMAYDEYTAADSPGPVAGFAWVDACVRKTLFAVAPQKLVLGLALYYRHWNGTTVTEGPFPVARALAAKTGVNISLNAAQKEATFGFSDGAAKHVVWGEDASNIAARFELIGKYKLAGYAAWRLGQEDPAVWRDVFRP